MRISPVFILRGLDAAFMLFAVVCAVLRSRERTRPIKFCLENAWFFALFFLGAGALLAIPLFVSDNASALFLGAFSMVCVYASLAAANQRVRWDAEGFWYHTAFRREIRFAYADIRWMRAIGMGRRGGPGTDLAVWAGRRFFLLDETTGWQRFASAYADWQTRNQRPSWRKAAEESWLARYHRHGPFRRKLDRIPGGHGLFAVFLILGLVFGTVGVLAAARLSDNGLFVAAPFVLSALCLGYIAAAAQIDAHPQWIKFYVKAKILPDPDNKTKKVYRKTRGRK